MLLQRNPDSRCCSLIDAEEALSAGLAFLRAPCYDRAIKAGEELRHVGRGAAVFEGAAP